MGTDTVAERYAALDRGWKACLWATLVVGLELLRVGV